MSLKGFWLLGDKKGDEKTACNGHRRICVTLLELANRFGWQRILGLSYRQFLVDLVEASRHAAIWIVSGVLLSTVGLLIYIATHLTVDTDPLNLLDPNLPFRHLKGDFEQAFPQLTDLIVVVIDGKNKRTVREATDWLAQQLDQQSRWFHSVYRPGQDEFFKRHGLLYLDREELWTLGDRLSKWEPFLGTLTHDPTLRGILSLLERALEDLPDLEEQEHLAQVLNWMSQTIEAQRAHTPTPPLWEKSLFTQDEFARNEHRQFLLVKTEFDYSKLQAAGTPLQVLRGLVSQAEHAHDVNIRLTGSVPIEDEERRSLAQQSIVAVLVSFSLVCLLLFWGVGNVRLVGAIIVTLFVGLVWTAAFATFAVGSLNFISATAPVLFIGLGVDFGIQFALRYKEERTQGIPHDLALRRAVLGIGAALTLSALAAAACFFSFFPTKYRGLAELGVIAGAGMFIAFVGNVTLLPALLTLFPIHPAPRATAPSAGDAPVWLSRYRRPILFIGILALGYATYLLPQIRFDFNPLHLKDPSTEAVSTFQELLEDPKTSPYTIQILTDDLPSARQLATRLKQLPEVEKAITLASFVPKDQEEKLTIIDHMSFVLQPIFDVTSTVAPPMGPENLEAVARFQQILAAALNLNTPRTPAFEQGLARLSRDFTELESVPGWPEGVLHELESRLLEELSEPLDRLRDLFTAASISLDDLPASLKTRYVTSDGRARIEVFPRENMNDNQALRRFVTAVTAVAPQAIGTPVALVAAGDVMVTASFQATGVALIGVTVLLLVFLRAIRDTLLVLLPVVLTVLLSVGTTVLIHLPLNLANMVALPLVLGLGIAFGIYVMHRKYEGLDVDRLLVSSTSRAVLFSALTTMVSFGSLAFSSHRGMSSMGVLLLLILLFALISALIILPACLAEMDSRFGASDLNRSS